LLALAVNEWNEDRINEQKAEKAIDNIIKELKINIKLINLIHTNNSEIVTIIRSPEEDSSSINRSFTPGLQIQDTAWNALISTGVTSHLDYETLYLISGIYSIQEIYKSFSHELIKTMMGTEALAKAIDPTKSNEDMAPLFLDNMQIVVDVEAGLLSQLKNGVEKLEELRALK
jgi:hypothetical protein